MSTAGRAVVFAGATVVISMLGLLLVGSGWLGGMGIGVSATVLATMVTSMTLLPALLGIAHRGSRSPAGEGLLAASSFAVAICSAPGSAGPAGRRGRGPRRRSPWRSSRFVPALRVRGAPPGGQAGRGDPRRTGGAGRSSSGPGLWLGGRGHPRRARAPVLGMRLGWADEGNFPRTPTPARPTTCSPRASATASTGPSSVTAVHGTRHGRRPHRRAAPHPRHDTGRRRRHPAGRRRPDRPTRLRDDPDPDTRPRRTRPPPSSSAPCATT
jgi:putative drug exporter of the RND superfamily